MGNLDKLKKQYSELKKKYKLPSFDELNQDFDVEKLQEKETEHLVKNMRRIMVEKIANIVRFLELIYSPGESPTPMFVFAMMKNIKPETKKVIEKLYKELSSIEISSLPLDIHHDEKAEAIFVYDTYKKWASFKPELSEITKKLSISSKKESKARGYLG